MKLIKITLLSFFILSTPAIFAKELHFQSGEYQNTLLELYTSEGCSSCPPADEWLSGFKQHPQLFSQIVPMAFHVDYWDYIGWRDEFAKPEYGQRQNAYYQQGGITQRYTPQLIKNGKGSRAYVYQHNTTNEKVGKLTVDVIDGTAYIQFQPQKSQKLQKLQKLRAHISLLGFGFENVISAGENEDKVLKHDFVVLGYKQKLSKTKRWKIKLPTTSKPAKRLALAVWVSTATTIKPIQATGSWLAQGK